MGHWDRKVKRLAPLLTVEDIMVKSVIWLDENDSLDMVMTLFERCHVSCAPVSSSQGGYVGLISKTDLFNKTIMNLILSRGSLENVAVGEVMSPQPIFVVQAGMSLEEVTEMMLEKSIHYLFVKDHTEQIVGMLSSYDVLRHQVRGMQDQLTGNIDRAAKKLLHHDS